MQMAEIAENCDLLCWLPFETQKKKKKKKNSPVLFITFKIVYNILYKSNVATNISTFQIAWLISTY